MEEHTCDNCSFSRLNPCPYLTKKECGTVDTGFVKWAPKRAKTNIYLDPEKEIKLDPPSEDDVEEETRKKMIDRRKKEKPARNMKVVLAITLIALVFMLIFGFKVMRFINHMVFGFLGLVIVLAFAYTFIKSKWGKK